jgi:hypothetical protein
MPNSGVSRKPSTLTVLLDDTLLAQLERQAAQYLISVDELVRRAIEQSLVSEVAKAPKKARPGATRHDEAPLDAFLPEGADPFAPVDVVTGLASNFEEVQARMRFAGTPTLLRDLG